jgi:hypothetical protein
MLQCSKICVHCCQLVSVTVSQRIGDCCLRLPIMPGVAVPIEHVRRRYGFRAEHTNRARASGCSKHYARFLPRARPSHRRISSSNSSPNRMTNGGDSADVLRSRNALSRRSWLNTEFVLSFCIRPNGRAFRRVAIGGRSSLMRSRVSCLEIRTSEHCEDGNEASAILTRFAGNGHAKPTFGTGSLG